MPWMTGERLGMVAWDKLTADDDKVVFCGCHNWQFASRDVAVELATCYAVWMYLRLVKHRLSAWHAGIDLKSLP